MKKNYGTVTVGVASLLLPLGIGLSTPAGAEPAPSTTATAPTLPTFSMPSVVGGTLQSAYDSIVALSPDTAFQVRPSVQGGEPVHVLSPSSWEVCRQSPAAESKISAKSRITLVIERPWTGC